MEVVYPRESNEETAQSGPQVTPRGKGWGLFTRRLLRSYVLSNRKLSLRDGNRRLCVGDLFQIGRVDQERGDEELSSAIHLGDLLPGGTYLDAQYGGEPHQSARKSSANANNVPAKGCFRISKQTKRTKKRRHGSISDHTEINPLAFAQLRFGGQIFLLAIGEGAGEVAGEGHGDFGTAGIPPDRLFQDSGRFRQ